MTFSSIKSRLTNDFPSRVKSLLAKTLHIKFWNSFATEDDATRDPSYNLAPIVGAIIGLVLSFVTILGRLVFTYRVFATIVAFICYLFFGFANSLYGFGLTIGESDKVGKLNKFGTVAITLAIILWCSFVTSMRPSRLSLSFMSAMAMSRFSACLVAYIKDTFAKRNESNDLSFDLIDLVVALLCVTPWLVLNLDRCLPALAIAVVCAMCVTGIAKRSEHGITERAMCFSIVVTEISTLLIWLV